VHGAWQPWEFRADRPDRWDANVNGWLNGNDLAGYPPDGRKFLVRLFQAAGDGLGVARAVLSDSYKVIDNLDALMATLDGIRQAGADVEFDGLDLTERRLYAQGRRPAIRDPGRLQHAHPRPARRLRHQRRRHQTRTCHCERCGGVTMGHTQPGVLLVWNSGPGGGVLAGRPGSEVSGGRWSLACSAGAE